jgi:transposase-like protein
VNPLSQQDQPPKKAGRPRKYDDAFRLQAVERLKTCTNVSALARELGIKRKWLYEWRDAAHGRVSKTKEVTLLKSTPEDRTKKRVASLEKLVAKQALELDFFKGALLRIEEQRRKREQTSGVPSTSKSATQTGSKANAKTKTS